MMLTCHHCGGQLQATSNIYWSLVEGRWVPEDFSDWEMKFYCENDCAVEVDHDTYVDLADAITRLALLVSEDTETTLVRQGVKGADLDDSGSPEYLDFIGEHMPHVIHVHDAPHPDGPVPAFVGPVLTNDADVVEFLAHYGDRAHLDPLWSLSFMRGLLEREEENNAQA